MGGPIAEPNDGLLLVHEHAEVIFAVVARLAVLPLLAVQSSAGPRRLLVLVLLVLFVDVLVDVLVDEALIARIAISRCGLSHAPA